MVNLCFFFIKRKIIHVYFEVSGFVFFSISSSDDCLELRDLDVVLFKSFFTKALLEFFKIPSS